MDHSSKTSLSKSEISAARVRFDSLMVLTLQQKWYANTDTKVKNLFECLSLAQYLNNDTLLATVYLRLSGYYDDLGEYNIMPRML